MDLAGKWISWRNRGPPKGRGRALMEGRQVSGKESKRLSL